MFQHSNQEQKNSGQDSSSGGSVPLSRQYLKVFTKPSATTFAQQMCKARWGIVWIQLLGFAFFSGLIFALIALLNRTRRGMTLSDTAEGVQLLTFIAFVAFVHVLALFFLHTGPFYVFAKVAGGQGTFLAQSYSILLFLVPSGILVEVLTLLIGFVTVSGWQLLAWPVWLIYSTVLDILVIKAVHRLSGGKSTAVVVLPLVAEVWWVASIYWSAPCCSPPPH